MKHAFVFLAGIGCLAACDPGKAGNPALPPVTMLSPDSAYQRSARFTPDGTRLFWWEPAVGRGLQLWAAGADLGNPTMVPVTQIDIGQELLWSPDGSHVAVASSDAGVGQVVILPTVGGAPRQLTHVSGIAVPNGWNPDGDRISYVASAAGAGGGTYRSFVTWLSHGGDAPLIPRETRPHGGGWSPDGSRIAYLVWEGGQSTIWIADSAGGNPRQLTGDGFEGLNILNMSTAWSPDGRRLVYESRRTGTSDIWVVPVDSGAPRQLTRDIRNDTDPRWSPDGKWIAFASDRGKQTDIWLVPAAGGPERRVTDDASVEALMQWRSDSTLAFLTGTGQSGIWAMSLADSSERRMTPDSIRAGGPTLSPDGTQVAFRIERGGGQSDLAVMPVAGAPMRIPMQGGDNSQYSWSPAGSQVVFWSDRGGTPDIWVVDAAGGEARQLTNWPGWEGNPVWSGDGSAIYFLTDRDARIGDVWQVSPTGGEPSRLTNSGSIAGWLTASRGRPELFAAAIGESGQYEVVRVNPDGTLVPIWQRSSAFPVGLLPAGDSLVISRPRSGGGFDQRVIPATGGGEGKPLLNPGEFLGGFSDDWTQLFLSIPNGATRDLALRDRSDGTTRRLTSNAVDESSPWITPDEKTVVFQRQRNVRRIATADLTKLLGGAQ